jgi:hypothetical protein
MNRCYAFSRCQFIRCPPRHLAVEDLLTQLLRCYTPTVCRIIQCWRTPLQNLTVRISETVGWTAVPPSVHPVLEGLVLARLCLDSNKASDRPTMSSLRPSDHSLLLSFAALLLPIIRHIYKMDRRFIRWCQIQFFLLRSVPSTPTLASRVLSVHSTVSFLFLSFFIFDPWKIDYILNLAYGIFASLGPINIYKDMLNNMVSPIDHVVMNHQNQTRTNGIWGHVRYT